MVPLCLNVIMYLVDTVYIYSEEEDTKTNLEKNSLAKNSLLDLFSLTSDLTESGIDTSSELEI